MTTDEQNSTYSAMLQALERLTLLAGTSSYSGMRSCLRQLERNLASYVQGSVFVQGLPSARSERLSVVMVELRQSFEVGDMARLSLAADELRGVLGSYHQARISPVERPRAHAS